MIFDWKWQYEIAPMYMRVMGKPFTAPQQEFRVLCGIKSNATFSGSRLPIAGEQIYFPAFKKYLIVTGLRSWGLSTQQQFSRKTLVTVYFDPKQIGDDDYWCITSSQMRPVENWSWSTDFYHYDYENYGYEPSDWKNPKLKFKERDYVLGWRKNGSGFIAEDGKTFLSLDPKHSYLKDWFPEVDKHLSDVTWGRK